MGRRGFRRHKRQFQVFDDPVYRGTIRNRSDDLHRPAEIGRIPIVSVMSHLFQQWRQYKEELNRLISDRVELS